jgi:hypothetical protein
MKASPLLLCALSLLAGVVVGWSFHVPPSVHAADAPPMQFQLQGTGPATELGIYFPNDKDLYVYPGVAAGSSSVNCAFKLHVARAGAPLERTNCGIGKLN